jgi:hypothetical protein
MEVHATGRVEGRPLDDLKLPGELHELTRAVVRARDRLCQRQRDGLRCRGRVRRSGQKCGRDQSHQQSSLHRPQPPPSSCRSSTRPSRLSRAGRASTVCDAQQPSSPLLTSRASRPSPLAPTAGNGHRRTEWNDPSRGTPRSQTGSHDRQTVLSTHSRGGWPSLAQGMTIGSARPIRTERDSATAPCHSRPARDSQSKQSRFSEPHRRE